MTIDTFENTYMNTSVLADDVIKSAGLSAYADGRPGFVNHVSMALSDLADLPKPIDVGQATEVLNRHNCLWGGFTLLDVMVEAVNAHDTQQARK